jgi:hypothetical protein
MKRLLLVHNNTVAPAATFPRVSPVRGRNFPILRQLVINVVLTLIILVAAKTLCHAQDDKAAYKQSIQGRVAKIVNTLAVTDSAAYYRLMDRISNQYYNLNVIHAQYTTAVTAIKNNSSLSKTAIDKAVQKQEKKKQSRLAKLHRQFIAGLRKDISEEQVDLVKDGMTYRVFPITYAAYLDKIPGLTEEQKSKIYVWLREARELAMDEGSSEDKHRVFGKYKGRINNYLSEQGYDLKKEEKAWQERLRQRRQKEKA